MAINPEAEICNAIASLENRLAGFLVEETRLKMSVQKLESPKDIKNTYDRLKRVQDAIFKHQVYLVTAYSKLHLSGVQPTQTPEADTKPFGIGEISVIDVPTP